MSLDSLQYSAVTKFPLRIRNSTGGIGCGCWISEDVGLAVLYRDLRVVRAADTSVNGARLNPTANYNHLFYRCLPPGKPRTLHPPTTAPMMALSELTAAKTRCHHLEGEC